MTRPLPCTPPSFPHSGATSLPATAPKLPCLSRMLDSSGTRLHLLGAASTCPFYCCCRCCLKIVSSFNMYLYVNCCILIVYVNLLFYEFFYSCITMFALWMVESIIITIIILALLCKIPSIFWQVQRSSNNNKLYKINLLYYGVCVSESRSGRAGQLGRTSRVYKGIFSQFV